MRGIPHRRFDWDAREWWAPVDDWVAHPRRRRPASASPSWRRAEQVERGWRGRAALGRARHDDAPRRARLVGAETLAGELPAALREGAVERGGANLLVPLTRGRRAGAARAALGAARRRRRALRRRAGAGRRPAAGAARRDRTASTARGCGSRCCGIPTRAPAFAELPGAEGERAVPLDPWLCEPLDAFLALHGVEVGAAGGARAGSDCAPSTPRRRRRSAPRARPRREPIEEVAAVLGGDAGAVPVGRRPLRAERAARVPRRRAGARQDGRGARRARGRRRVPGGRRLPGVAEAQLGARDARAGCRTAPSRVVEGRVAVPPRARRSRSSTTSSSRPSARRSRCAARARSCSTSRTTSRTRRPSARARCGGWPRACRATALRLALTGTPVLNHADELIAQLRVLGRLEDFGSGARFSPQFHGALTRGAAALAPAPPLLRAPAASARCCRSCRTSARSSCRSRWTTSASTGSPRTT